MTRFSEEFSHAGGAQPRNPDLRRNLYAALIAYACNLGYAGMADASGISEDQLAWTSQWYLRQETLRAANTRLVNAHHAHPLAALWGGGTLSSSDGQRFPQRGRSLTAPALSRYFLDEGTTTYTTSPINTRPTAARSSPRPGGKPSPYSMRSSATPPIWPSASTPSTPPGRPSRHSQSSTWPGCSSHHASATSADSSSTAWAPPQAGAPDTRTPDRCSANRSRPS